MLWMLQRVAFGQARTEAARQLTDLNAREMLTVVPLAIAVVAIGVYPGPLLESMDASVTYVVERLAQY
jgi:NADH-quinone oxidoreductase subunit M